MNSFDRFHIFALQHQDIKSVNDLQEQKLFRATVFFGALLRETSRSAEGAQGFKSLENGLAKNKFAFAAFRGAESSADAAVRRGSRRTVLKKIGHDKITVTNRLPRGLQPAGAGLRDFLAGHRNHFTSPE